MNVPPSKQTYIAPQFSQNRRKMLGLLWWAALLPGVNSSFVPGESSNVSDEIRMRFSSLMERLSLSKKVNPITQNSSRITHKSLDLSNKKLWQLTSENPDEAKILQNFWGLIARLCRDLNLDMDMMVRLVLHESKGMADVSSHRWAQWLMQIMPPTAQDFVKRYTLYESHFQNISPEVLRHLKSSVARNAMKTLTQPGNFSTRTGEAAIRSMLFELFNPEINLIFGHIYFAGLKSQLEPKIEDFQRDLSRYFATLTPAQYQRISTSRKAIGASPVSLEYLKGDYAKRLYRDADFALDTESLIQYNGGGNRPKQSYNYAAIIQV